MKNSSMTANPSAISQSLLARTKEPATQLAPEIFILGKFVRDISEVLNSHFFRASDKYDVVFLSETDIGKDKVMGETSGLGVVAWSGSSTGWVVRAITMPALTMEFRSGLRHVVARREVNPREGLDHLGGELHLSDTPSTAATDILVWF